MPEVPQSAPRFGFRKAKRVEKEPSTADVVTDAKSPEYSVQKTTSPGLVSKRQREHIISDAAFGVVGGSHSLSNLVECIVDLRAQQVSAIYLNQLDRCLVLAPTVTGSVFVQNARQCVFMLGCHQASNSQLRHFASHMLTDGRRSCESTTLAMSASF